MTTRVARTLCDLAGVLHPGRTERAIDNCLAMGIATPGTLQAAFSDLASRGRKGTAVMRRLLADRSDGYVPPASELEARFRDLVRDAGLPEPVRQLDVGDDEAWIGRVDVAYPPARLLIELDSRRHHSSKLDGEADADPGPAAPTRRVAGRPFHVGRPRRTPGWVDLGTPPPPRSRPRPPERRQLVTVTGRLARENVTSSDG